MFPFAQTDEGILISRQELLARNLFEQLGALLNEDGITLEELMESGGEIREALVKEKYGLG